MTMTARDAALSLTRALPNGAATVTSTSLDTRNSTRGDLTAHTELEISAPALTTGQLGNGATITYSVIGSTAADLSNPVTIAGSVLVQTGAGGTGAAAASKRVGLPTNCPRYIGFTATNSAAGNASAANATAALVF
jgi:hypothetical protein